jgi:hypothetical protein
MSKNLIRAIVILLVGAVVITVLAKVAKAKGKSPKTLKGVSQMDEREPERDFAAV